MGFIEKVCVVLREVGWLWASGIENPSLQEVCDVDVEQFTACVKKSVHGVTQTRVYYESVCLKIRIANTVWGKSFISNKIWNGA